MFSVRANYQLKDTPDVITLNYRIPATFHTILYINFRNFAKCFAKKILTSRFLRLSFYFIQNQKLFFMLRPNSWRFEIFPCASCSSSYIGKTCRYFKTRIEEHIKKGKKSHISKHLHSTATWFDSYNSLFF